MIEPNDKSELEKRALIALICAIFGWSIIMAAVAIEGFIR